MEYAVIRTGGKQYKVSEGSVIEVNKLSGNKDEEMQFEEVLLWVLDGEVKIGRPKLPDIKVKGKILEQKKGGKLRIGKFKAKVRYRRIIGFRPLLTKLKIEKIEKAS